MKTRIKIFPLRISPFSCPKSGKDQNKKRSSLKFSPVFGPKLGDHQKKKSSLKFSPILAQNWVKAQKNGLRPPFLCSNLLPKLQNGWPCRSFTYYPMLFTLSCRSKGGEAMAPPKYAPAGSSIYVWEYSQVLDLLAHHHHNLKFRLP